MTRTEAILLAVTATLFVAWLSATLGGGIAPPVAVPPPVAIAPSAEEQLVAALETRAAAYRARPAEPGPLARPGRNPFAFAEFPRAAAKLPEADVQAVPPGPDIRLKGVAEDVVDGRTTRTAILSVDGQLVFAREGERIRSRFLVVRIAADAVQLNDEEKGEGITLALK